MRERHAGWIDGREAVALAVFAGVALLLSWAMWADIRPAPVYALQASHADSPAVFVTRLMSVEMRLRRVQGAERIRVPVWTDETRRPLEISLMRPGEDEPLARVRVAAAGLASIDIPESIAPGEVVSLRFTSESDSRETSPRVLWAESPPRAGVRTFYAGRPIAEHGVLPDTGPLILVEYAWPTRRLALLWLLPIFGLPLVLRTPRAGLWWLVALALAASVTSALLWQRDYTRSAVHLDTDQYAESATALARYATEPDARETIRAWLRAHPHTTTLGVPALLAVPVALGVPVQIAYMHLCALAGFLTLLILHRLLHRDLHVDAGLAWLVVGAFACHPMLLRSFSRPITDIVGLLLVVMTLVMLVRRLSRVDVRADIGLGLLLLAHVLARPQGLGYWPFVALAVVAADFIRTRERPTLVSTLHRGLRLFGPPGLVLVLLTLQFGWLHNFELMLEKAGRFRVNSTLPIFLTSLVGCLHWLPLLWWPARARLRDPRVALWAVWGVYVIALLVVVRAPYWPRHFLPALPSVFVLTGLGLDALQGRRRRLGVSLLIVSALFGLAITLWQVHSMGALPGWLAGLVRSP
ncbi:MAG: hypothetical protein JRG92_03160 [Deltaproteobacteria bacterium]|nr:hypothetical protein [Deltaproteobacteria bacterium]MBW2382603.1 hypothetical protein [Deltaproteobacteria bacterium]